MQTPTISGVLVTEMGSDGGAESLSERAPAPRIRLLSHAYLALAFDAF